MKLSLHSLIEIPSLKSLAGLSWPCPTAAFPKVERPVRRMRAHFNCLYISLSCFPTRLGGRAVSSSPCQCGALRNSCGLTWLNANDVCCFNVDFLVQQQEEACFQGLTSHLSFCFCGLPALAFACPSSGLGVGAGCRLTTLGGALHLDALGPARCQWGPCCGAWCPGCLVD